MPAIRVRTVFDDPQMEDAINSCWMEKSTPAKTVAHLNKIAKKRGLSVTYVLATEEEYWEYRAKVRAAIAG